MKSVRFLADSYWNSHTFRLKKNILFFLFFRQKGFYPLIGSTPESILSYQLYKLTFFVSVLHGQSECDVNAVSLITTVYSNNFCVNSIAFSDITKRCTFSHLNWLCFFFHLFQLNFEFSHNFQLIRMKIDAKSQMNFNRLNQNESQLLPLNVPTSVEDTA